jgi:LPS sulfotransferase NodH
LQTQATRRQDRHTDSIDRKLDPEGVFDPALDWPRAPVQSRFLVLATARTGSSLVCSMLADSGVAGRPIEYLRPHNIEAYKAVRGYSSPYEILDDLKGRRTTPNGYFGLKLHPQQLMKLFGQGLTAEGAAFLRGFSRFVLCSRRGKLDQAISHLLAMERKVWNQTNDEGAPDFPLRQFGPGDTSSISRILMTHVLEDEFWREVIRRLDLPYVEVAYEDLSEDPAGQMARVFEFLGLGVAKADIPPPSTRKLADASNAQLREGFLKAIGAPI